MKEQKRKGLVDIIEKIMKVVFAICGFLAVLFVVVITIFLVISGLPGIREIGIFKFLFGTVWASTAENAQYGILPFILTSVYGTLTAVTIGSLIGIACSVFISKLGNKLMASVLSQGIQLLAAIPSVVYGLVGMIVVVPFVRETFNLSDGATLCSAIIVLAVMVLPAVISVSESAIRAVPQEYEEASLALGATKTETIFKVILPSAKSGILTAVVLGIGRGIGEAMAVMMVSGNVANMPSLFKSVRFLTTAIASEMSYSSGLQREALFSVALVLFIFILFINLILNLIIKKERR